jgi:ATP-dependent exoDNAse (exonuclease V) beta subunit
VGWTGQSGRPFEWRICRTPSRVVDVGALSGREEGVGQGSAGSPQDVFGPITDESAITRMAVTDWLAAPAQQETSRPGIHGEVTAGILIHRLFQSAEILEGRAEDAQFAYARGLLQPEERAALEDIDIDATVTAALVAWRTMRARADIAGLLASGRRLHEVPFSMRTVKAGTPVVLRGAIDCLIQKDDGSIVVVEFKTGRRRSSHQHQLDVYVEAARAMFPGASVEGRLVYPD